MKTKLLFVILFSSTGLLSFAQYNKGNYASNFVKTIEPAMITSGKHNLKSKTSIQEKMFPDVNSRVEYFAEPSFSGAYGFRILKINDRAYKIEVKWISNWDEAQKKVAQEIPIKNSDKNVLDKKSKEEKEQILAYNRQQYKKRDNEVVSKYTVSSKNIYISNVLANQLYSSFMTLIRDYKNKGIPPTILDGTNAIFRCVVYDEVWNFSIHEPSGEFGKLMEICDSMVRKAQANKIEIEEKEYLRQLLKLSEKK